MLGVFKRRWKPKRSSNASRIPPCGDGPAEIDRDKPRLGPSVRQVHPLCEDKAHLLCYDKHSPTELRQSLNETNASPPPYPKRASLESNPSPTQCYPLTPNICVEAGRIQFIKQETEGGNDAPPDGLPTPPATPIISGRVTVTRGQQTDDGVFDDVKISLERRISELKTALDEAQKNELRDKQTITKLQKQLAKRESAQRDVDRERRLRADSESRTKQALQEAARCRSRLKLLTNEFARMEDNVRSMLVYKKQVEHLRQEKNALTLTFENRCQQYQSTISRLNQEIVGLRRQLDEVGRCDSFASEDIFSAHTTALHRYAEETRKQYERCLDDVANQVVRALLAQKGLREEIVSLNCKIHDLESQNKTLTSMLVHHMKGDAPSHHHQEATFDDKLILENVTEFSPSTSDLRHCNSFDSEISADISDKVISKIEKRLSANTEILDTRLSFEDKKRHQVLTKLWTELKGAEVTPTKLLEALNTVDSSLWVPPRRPVSLNLHFPIVQSKYRKQRQFLDNFDSIEASNSILSTQNSSKSEEETTGNDESPESGNRDEGYSTMSSDVQVDPTRGEAIAIPGGLEDLKEATDENDLAETRLLATDNKDPDILYIPFDFLNLKPRNSYPPGKNVSSFQHIMRSFSDSHLCIKITTAPSPCCSFGSPISSSPSIFFVDITDKNPLKRSRANGNLELGEDRSSWSSAVIEDRLECTTWDAEYIQHWLRLDETRSTLQQQHRDLLELEYDRAELEDWSLSLSNDDLREQWKRLEVTTVATTPGQLSISAALPSIQENNTLELEEDANECLWNNSSYMMDKEGRELVTLLMDASGKQDEKPWPYAVHRQISPDNSWSSGASDCCHSVNDIGNCSKRSSAALSGCSDDTGELAIGTDFTRDFYRLVKFESTKSLASTSSRSLAGALSDTGDRETTLQNVLTFIAEQQKYVNHREKRDSRPCSVNDVTKEFNIEGPPQQLDEIKICDSDLCLDQGVESKTANGDSSENYVTLRQLCEEFNERDGSDNLKTCVQNIAYANQVCLVTPLDVESENCSNIGEVPVDICSTISVNLNSDEIGDDSNEHPNVESSSSSDVIVSKVLPSRKLTPSKIPTKIPNKGKIKSKLQPIVHHVQQPQQHVITCEKLPQPSSGVVSNIIDGPPHRAVSFHERATSKDVIDELNRMIKNGEDGQDNNEENVVSKLDLGCQSTGWIHVERDIDLTDPKARANLLDVMMASVSSDSSPTSSCGGSVASDTTEDPPNYSHLHKIHRFHRQKKANAIRPDLAVVRAQLSNCVRPTIMGRPDFYVRYGEKEKEAVASFDFLDELSTTSSSLSCSVDETVDMEEK